MGHEALPETVHPFAQWSMFCFAQVWIACPEVGGHIACQFDHRCVAQIGHVQFGHSALAYAEEVARTALLQVCFGEAEAVVGLLKDAETFLRMDTGICAQYITIRLMFATSNTPTELMQL